MKGQLQPLRELKALIRMRGVGDQPARMVGRTEQTKVKNKAYSKRNKCFLSLRSNHCSSRLYDVSRSDTAYKARPEELTDALISDSVTDRTVT